LDGQERLLAVPRFDDWLAGHADLNSSGVFNSPFSNRVGIRPLPPPLPRRAQRLKESDVSEPAPGPNGSPRPSSRESLAGAGWLCRRPGSYKQLLTKRNLPFSWLNPVPLLQSRNDLLARERWFGQDPTNERRRDWLGDPPHEPDLVIDHSDSDEISFIVMGDTGEGDASQYAVVPALLNAGAGTAFLVICSDVVYPAGGINDYLEKFFRPYQAYPAPIYALPGNHDWYDDLTGLMFHFCGVESAPARERASAFSRAWLRDLLWRKPQRAKPKALAEMRRLRSAPGKQPPQPGPYFAIDAGALRLVAIDTGITNSLDRDQGEWLRRVSADRRPKVLLTGKPIYVDGEHHAGDIEGSGSVDEIVTDRQNNYIAAIGGDIHNYQRYPVTLPDGRMLQYLVSGGGGAFMHSTHQIPRVSLEGVTEEEFRCYPLRGDSLSIYSKLYDKKLRLGRGGLYIPPDQAAAIMAERLGIESSRDSAKLVEASHAARLAAEKILPRRSRAHGPFHLPFSEFFDWNDPPLFKNFLRIDVSPNRVRLRCFAATGCGEHEQNPPIEDAFYAELQDGGEWRWATETRGEPD